MGICVLFYPLLSQLLTFVRLKKLPNLHLFRDREPDKEITGVSLVSECSQAEQ